MATRVPLTRVRDFAHERAVFLEHMAHHRAAAGEIDQVRFKTDQPAGGDDGFDADPVRMVRHIDDLRLAPGEGLENIAEAFIGHFEPERFVRFLMRLRMISFAKMTSGRGDEALQNLPGAFVRRAPRSAFHRGR